MAKIEPNRKWIVTEDSYKYSYKIFKGLHPIIGRFYAHFNPGLLFRLLKNDYEIAVVGGMASPTHWLAPFFINQKKIQITSIESNLHSTERKTGIGAWLKKILLKKADCYQITGSPQKEYICYFNQEAIDKPFIKMPNLVDEEVFFRNIDILRKNILDIRNGLGLNVETQMWVLPARLIAIKGIMPFLNLLEGIENIKLFILGDGELRSELKKLVVERKLPVEIVGFLQESRLVEYYAAADLFVLPSLKDPSPLSPIEASAASLPLLVSSRIGNLEDVLEEGINGWCYDPMTEIDKAKQLIFSISHMKREELKNMGVQSRQNFLEKFDAEVCIREYAKQIKSVLNCV